MRIEGEVLRGEVLDPEVGDETPVAAALLIMDDGIADAGLGTGWYWMRTEGQDAAEAADVLNWKAAVNRGAGPYRSADSALTGAERWTPETAELVRLLDYGAELARTAEIGPEEDSTVEWLRTGYAAAAERKKEQQDLLSEETAPEGAGEEVHDSGNETGAPEDGGKQSETKEPARAEEPEREIEIAPDDDE